VIVGVVAIKLVLRPLRLTGRPGQSRGWTQDPRAL